MLHRIFIDKVFAAQFYYKREMYGDVAKHIYDLTVLLDNEQIQNFLSNKERVLSIVALKRKEELARKGAVDEKMQIANFEYFSSLKENKEFAKSFADDYILCNGKHEAIIDEEVWRKAQRQSDIQGYAGLGGEKLRF